jgi:hypothetical protein
MLVRLAAARGPAARDQVTEGSVTVEIGQVERQQQRRAPPAASTEVGCRRTEKLDMSDMD